MVQLQKDLGKIHAEKTEVIAISYDPVKSLAKLADRKKIAYPLLSDPDSKVIKEFGIYNEKASGFARGIPHPGTFVVDRKGVVRAKIFLKGYRKRHKTEQLLEAIKSLR